MSKKLTFPFEAEIVEHVRHGSLRIGDRVTVKGIRYLDDTYGLLVEVTSGRHSGEFPLCDLEAIDKQAKNFQLVKDYAVWYANR